MRALPRSEAKFNTGPDGSERTMLIDEIPTPALTIDLDALERNIQKMQDFVRSRGCNLRPHAKSHKSPFVARKQIRAGALGQCCQTILEAEAMVMSGIDGVLLTHYLASAPAIERFLNLSKNGGIMITVDGKENAEMLAKAARHRGLTADVVVEVDIGTKKVGHEPGEACARFARWISETDGLRFRGIMGYEGHLQITTPNFEERKTKARDALSNITSTLAALEREGLDPEVVSCGGTGTYNITAGYPGVTEIQPGSYTVMDGKYSEILPAGQDFEKAMHVIATVVSAPTSTRAVTDLGWKGVGIEYGAIGLSGLPTPLLEGVRYTAGGDEHGVLNAEEAGLRPNVGDRVAFIPAHCDTTLNLYGVFYGVRGNRVETVCSVVRR